MAALCFVIMRRMMNEEGLRTGLQASKLRNDAHLLMMRMMMTIMMISCLNISHRCLRPMIKIMMISCLNVSPICVKCFEAGKSSLVVPDLRKKSPFWFNSKSLKTDVIIQTEDIFKKHPRHAI